jgi:hypothetical protein
MGKTVAVLLDTIFLQKKCKINKNEKAGVDG